MSTASYFGAWFGGQAWGRLDFGHRTELIPSYFSQLNDGIGNKSVGALNGRDTQQPNNLVLLILDVM